MTDTQIKDYLKKYRIDSEESLAKHIEELKRNTKPNNEIIFTLVDLLLNEKSTLNSFFAENKIRVNFYKDDVVTVKDGFKDLQGIINYFLDSDFDTYFAYKGGQLISQDFKKVTRTIAPFFLDEADISYQSFEDGKFKDNTVTYTSTRHKAREEGSFHKEIVGDLEGVNKPKGVEVSLRELKENTINNVELGLDIADILGIALCDNRDYIYKLIEKKISAKKDKIKTAKLHTYPLTPEECFKDDVITNSNRGEKETMEYLQGVKETEGKLDYELDWEFIEQMAERMSQNKGKYEPYNWKRPMEVEKLKQSLFRHVIEIMKGNYSDDGRDFGHFESVALNSMMINYQLKNNV